MARRVARKMCKTFIERKTASSITGADIRCCCLWFGFGVEWDGSRWIYEMADSVVMMRFGVWILNSFIMLIE